MTALCQEVFGRARACRAREKREVINARREVALRPTKLRGRGPPITSHFSSLTSHFTSRRS
jgi:hypothetical protein